MARGKLSDKAQAEFESVYRRLLGAGLPADVDLVRAYAVAVVEMGEAQEQIDRNGSVVRIGQNVQVSPYVTIRDRALEKVERIGARLQIDQAMAEPRGAETPSRRKATEMKYTQQQVIDALESCLGHKTEAARRLGCNPSTVHRYIVRYPKVAAAAESAKDNRVELAESKILADLRRGVPYAVVFTLKTLGRERGWVERPPASTGAEGEGEVITVVGGFTPRRIEDPKGDG